MTLDRGTLDAGVTPEGRRKRENGQGKLCKVTNLVLWFLYAGEISENELSRGYSNVAE